MPAVPVALVLASCVLHAWWNLLVKRAGNKLAFTALYLVVPPILYLPVFIYFVRSASIPPAGWLCICATAVVYFGYFLGLAYAYRGGELSVAYPVARGLGPALAFCGAIALLGERPSAAGACGVALILAAVLVLCKRRSSVILSEAKDPDSDQQRAARTVILSEAKDPDSDQQREGQTVILSEAKDPDPNQQSEGGSVILSEAKDPGPNRQSDRRTGVLRFAQDDRGAILAALFVALMMGCYSLIDKVAVGRLGINPVVYIYCTYTLSACLTVPVVAMREGVAALRTEWRANGRSCVAVGMLNLGAYLMVLFALASPSGKVSYIVPLRTTSVLIGVLFGVGVLREGRAAAKVCAALAMMAGIALITWKG